MKTPLLAAAVALTTLAASTVATRAAQSASGQPIDKAFAKGGAVVMRLSAGDYRIAGIADDKIRVDWRVDRASDADNVKARVDISGTKAVIETSGANHGGVHYTIDVPDLESAKEWAARIPTAPIGSVEVREVVVFPAEMNARR